MFALYWTEQVVEDMSIQANVPALAMEEVKSYFLFFSNLLSWTLFKLLIDQNIDAFYV